PPPPAPTAAPPPRPAPASAALRCPPRRKRAKEPAISTGVPHQTTGGCSARRRRPRKSAWPGTHSGTRALASQNAGIPFLAIPRHRLSNCAGRAGGDPRFPPYRPERLLVQNLLGQRQFPRRSQREFFAAGIRAAQ